ncbi:MAG: hypothetical protein ACK4P3_03410 [Fimbriimonadaceae bacterium]
MTKQAWIFIYVAAGLLLIGVAIAGYYAKDELDYRARPGGVAFAILAEEPIKNVRLDGEPMNSKLQWDLEDRPNFYLYGPVHRRSGPAVVQWEDGNDKIEAEIVIPEQKPFDLALQLNLFPEWQRNRREESGVFPREVYAASAARGLKVLEVKENGEVVSNEEILARIQKERSKNQPPRFSPR